MRPKPSPPDSLSPNQQIARAAGIVTLAFIISNLTGLIRQILVADAFGTSDAMEAFNAANRISETLFNLVAGGALGSAFIPTFTSLLAKEKRQQAWKLASSITNLVLIVLTLTAAAAAIFAPQVVRYILAPGFAADPAKEALTISLTRLMLPSTVLFGLSGLVMGILNSHQVFFIPALVPSMYQIGMIFGVTVLSPKIGIHGLAWGVIIGAALHLLLQLPILVKQRGKYSLSLGLRSPNVREVARLMGPRLLGVAVVQLNFWINVRLASLQPAGSVAAIQFAFALMLMPQAAIAQSIATAALPTFSTQVAKNKLDEMRRSLSATLRGILLLSIPASLGLILLRKPVITLLYQRGEYLTLGAALVCSRAGWSCHGGNSFQGVLRPARYKNTGLYRYCSYDTKCTLQFPVLSCFPPPGMDASRGFGTGEYPGNCTGDGRLGPDNEETPEWVGGEKDLVRFTQSWRFRRINGYRTLDLDTINQNQLHFDPG